MALLKSKKNTKIVAKKHKKLIDEKKYCKREEKNKKSPEDCCCSLRDTSQNEKRRTAQEVNVYGREISAEKEERAVVARADSLCSMLTQFSMAQHLWIVLHVSRRDRQSLSVASCLLRCPICC
jgi:hypothetical protein